MKAYLAEDLSFHTPQHNLDMGIARNVLPTKYWGCRSVEVYQKINIVGKGSFGNVFKAKISGKNSRSGKDQMVALKQINRISDKQDFPITSLREVRLLSVLKHENIVDFIEVVTSKSRDPSKPQGSMYLVFEYMEHDLTSIIGNKEGSLSAAQIKCIMKQLLDGVSFLHNHNVMHRDIKAANILVSGKGEVKLADFGLGLQMTEQRVNYTNPVVTLWYRAPELLLGSNNYTPAIDVWSVGCCFAELLNSGSIFNAPNEPKMLEQIYQVCGSPDEEAWPGVSTLRFYKDLQPKKPYPRSLPTIFKENGKVDEHAMDLLDKMLILNPDKRITAKEALGHDYFTSKPLPCATNELPLPEKDAHEYEIRHVFTAGDVNTHTQRNAVLEACKRKLPTSEVKSTMHLEPKSRDKA